jgi:hypothetical protein
MTNPEKRGKPMKRLVVMAVLGAALMVAPIGAQEKGATTGKVKQVTPVKLTITLAEFDGEKKISNLPYALLLNSEPGEALSYTSFARTGVRVPMPGVGSDGKAYSFSDVGTNIDCGVRTDDDGRFTLRLNFERSSLYFQGQGDEKGTIRTISGGQPYLPAIRAQSLLTIRDGQSVEALSAADPINGHVFRLSVTLNVQK